MTLRPTLLAISTLVCILMYAMTQSVYADENKIQISIASDFPNYFTASLQYQADSSIEIEDVSFVFHVSGQEVERYYREPLATATDIDIDYRIRTDTTHRYIPPGSTVTYFFQITHEGNKTVKTPTNSFMYLDNNRPWRSRTSDNLTVVFYNEDEKTALSILETALATTESVGGLFGASLKSPLTIVIYETWEDMLPAIRFSSKTVQQELITLGQAHPASGIIMLIGGDQDVLSSTRHETIHMLIYSMLEDSDAIIPFWFNEGIAEFQNPTHVKSYNRAISESVQTSSLPRLDYFTNRPNTPEDIWLMYAMGSRFTDFLITSKGPNKMRLLLEGLVIGKSFDKSFQDAYSLELIDAENEWRTTIKAPMVAPLEQNNFVSETPAKEIDPSSTPSTTANSTITESGSRFSSCGKGVEGNTSFLPENVALLLAPAAMSLLKRRKTPFTSLSRHVSRSASVSEEQNNLSLWV